MPGSELALGVVAAAPERAALLRAALHEVAPVLGALHPGGYGLGALALGIF